MNLDNSYLVSNYYLMSVIMFEGILTIRHLPSPLLVLGVSAIALTSMPPPCWQGGGSFYALPRYYISLFALNSFIT